MKNGGAYEVDGQMSLFDTLPNKNKPGDWVTEHGAELTFDEITQMVGQLIIMDKSTESTEWYQVVRVERIANRADGRVLVYYDGTRQNGYVSELFFPDRYKGRFPSRAYRI